MHKENKDTAGEKGGKKTKEASTRRSSVVPAPAQSAGDKSLAASRRGREPSPDMKTITRVSRRISAVPQAKSSGLASSDDQSSSPAGTSPKRVLTRSSSLRPRNSLANSALPKYRPKSVLIESSNVKAPPSPSARGVHRRRYSTSEEDKVEMSKQLLPLEVSSSVEKSGRAISPLPHKGALKVNLTGAMNVRPSTPERKKKSSTPTPDSSPSRRRDGQPSPTRLPTSRIKQTKPAKLAASVAPGTVNRTAAQRPPSSASSSCSSRAPQSPTTPTMVQRIAEQSGGTARLVTNQTQSPLRSSVRASQASPLSNASVRRRGQQRTPSPSPSPSGLMPLHATSSLISTPGPIIMTPNSSMDSMEASDVEFMLSTIASPSAPTPALPRFRTIRASDPEPPQTPLRGPQFLPTRANMSYLSPMPPASEGSPFLRLRPKQAGNDRGSILSWEHLAQHSRSLDQDDVEHMLADIDAPFGSVTASPAPSTLYDIPESPSLSALPSPTGYGSISQVLLPDVTPSPAAFNATLRFDEMAAEAPHGDGGNVTMLRLQLAAAESSANEQQLQIEALEAQLNMAKEARLRDTEELAQQITFLEEQVRGSLRPDEQLQQHAASLEEQLAHARAAQTQAVNEALKQAQVAAARAQQQSLRKQQARWYVSSAARDAGVAWSSAKCVAEGELEYVRSSQDVLGVLLAGLDRMLQQS